MNDQIGQMVAQAFKAECMLELRTAYMHILLQNMKAEFHPPWRYRPGTLRRRRCRYYLPYSCKETGLLHDEGPDKDKGFGPYVQSERQAQESIWNIQQLVEQGDAYYCFCKKGRTGRYETCCGRKRISIYDKRCLKLSKKKYSVVLMQENHVIVSTCQQRNYNIPWQPDVIWRYHGKQWGTGRSDPDQSDRYPT